MNKFLLRYKWYLIGFILAYLAVTLWLFFFTGTPQDVPFEYQVF